MKIQMNLETNFQILENVNKYADFEFSFFFQIFNENIYCFLKRARLVSGWVIRCEATETEGLVLQK